MNLLIDIYFIIKKEKKNKLTWSSVLPATSIPLTSNTSSLTASRPVLSAKPPGTSLLINTPGTFSIPPPADGGNTRKLSPSLI